MLTTISVAVNMEVLNELKSIFERRNIVFDSRAQMVRESLNILRYLLLREEEDNDSNDG